MATPTPPTPQQLDNARLDMESAVESIAVMLNQKVISDSDWKAIVGHLQSAILAQAVSGGQWSDQIASHLARAVMVNPLYEGA